MQGYWPQKEIPFFIYFKIRITYLLTQVGVACDHQMKPSDGLLDTFRTKLSDGSLIIQRLGMGVINHNKVLKLMVKKRKL